MKKSEWIIKVTYNSDNWKKYCEYTYPFKGTPKTLEKRILKHYNDKYENYGKAEAVEVELINDN